MHSFISYLHIHLEDGLRLWLLLLLWGTSQSKVALANARDLSGSRERMPKSTLSLPKCCCLFITVAGHFNQCPTVSGSSLHLLHVGDVFSSTSLW